MAADKRKQGKSGNPPAEARTKFFYDLTPERILNAVEQTGVRCTGRCMPLNSMENRVYEVEIEFPDDEPLEDPAARFRVVKFYRPGRWSEEQILEEHRFLRELKEREVPVVPPLEFEGGTTLKLMEGLGIFFAVFPKVRGRVPDEFTDEQLQWLGRLIARMHAVGAASDAPSRLRLTPQTYGRDNLSFLLSTGLIPPDLQDSYSELVNRICAYGDERFADVKLQRIHGDCHIGNILWGSDGPFFLDFDDAVVGPPVQALWLLIPGRDAAGRRKFEQIIQGYEQFRSFDRTTLRLVEVLRALRFIHFSAWIARRWEDPAFPTVFTQFGTRDYWMTQIGDLREQIMMIEHPGVQDEDEDSDDAEDDEGVAD